MTKDDEVFMCSAGVISAGGEWTCQDSRRERRDSWQENTVRCCQTIHWTRSCVKWQHSVPMTSFKHAVLDGLFSNDIFPSELNLPSGSIPPKWISKPPTNPTIKKTIPPLWVFQPKSLGWIVGQFFRCLGWLDSQWSNQNTVLRSHLLPFLVGAVIPKDFPAAHRREMAGHRKISWFSSSCIYFGIGPTFAGATSVQLVGQTGQRSVRTCQTQSLLTILWETRSCRIPMVFKLTFLKSQFSRWCRIPWCFFNRSKIFGFLNQKKSHHGRCQKRLWLWWAKWLCRGETERLGAGVERGGIFVGFF